MGLKFGNLYKLHGIIHYRISPFEQRAFAGLEHSIRSLPRRVLPQILPWGGPLLVAYLVYSWGTDTYHKSLRKNPDDYKDDE